MPGTIATPPVSTTGGVTLRPGHGRHARGQRRLHAGHDVRRQNARGQQADDLRLGKHHAHAADDGRAAALPASSPSAASRTPSRAASSSRKRPVPAAQRSFITKSPIVPSA